MHSYTEATGWLFALLADIVDMSGEEKERELGSGLA